MSELSKRYDELTRVAETHLERIKEIPGHGFGNCDCKTCAMAKFIISLPALKKEWEKEATLAEHKSHVDFENELYATLVDPVAEGSIKEAEMRKQLLESARWYRQHVHDLETQLNQLRSK